MDNCDHDFEGAQPEVDETTLVGDVMVGADARVCPDVVLRGDVGPVDPGESNAVGDTPVLHVSIVEREGTGMVGHGAAVSGEYAHPGDSHDDRLR